MIERMTLREKASLMSGADFWHTKGIARLGIRALAVSDGPHGLRKQDGSTDHVGFNASVPATCFPPSATLANSWDPALVQGVGAAIGAEAAAEGLDVVLGPGLNIKRNPLGGRNFEYYSEDPLLSGRLAAALVRGIQSRGVGACLKHFAVNSQETHRMAIDEIVDERALHEIYLEGFRIAIEHAAPYTVMTAYNRVNGTYANEHPVLLGDILRGRWGYDGVVMSDWGGNNDRVAALRAGSTLEMPATGGVTDAEIVRAVETGALDEAVLDTRVGELLTLIDRTAAPVEAPVDRDAHHELAREAARQSIVLLANSDGILPLAPRTRVAVIGDFAAVPRYQGSGSSLVNPTRLDTALDTLRGSDLDVVGYEPGFARRDAASARLYARALALAARADVTLLFLGLDESAEAEGIDRRHMRLADNQLALVRALVDRGRRIVVVLSTGSPVELPFADGVDAIVHGYLGGQGGGRALADALTGAVNPSGKLAETYPIEYEHVPSWRDFGRTEATSEHRESIYVGYRYFDKVGIPVRYPFGHGLSYTTFAYSDLEAGPDAARVTVTNTGNRSGAEVVQLYVEAPGRIDGAFRAVRELRGFAKVALEPGESETVKIAYAQHAFEIYDADAGGWRRIGGTYGIAVGASSRDIRLRADLAIDGDPLPRTEGVYGTGHVERATGADFEAVLGRPLPSPLWPRDRPLTRHDLVAQARGRRGLGGLLVGTLDLAARMLVRLGRPYDAAMLQMGLGLRFESLARMSGGGMSDAMVDALLLAVNGRFFRGIARYRAAARAHKSTR